mmetsp:Transcript_39042/g.85045  ORF Transcript_39042/g.85045 Transcript_39042/m.85045 type:complete len:182 (-) Transcript_39042:4-549(-)
MAEATAAPDASAPDAKVAAGSDDDICEMTTSDDQLKRMVEARETAEKEALAAGAKPDAKSTETSLEVSLRIDSSPEREMGGGKKGGKKKDECAISSSDSSESSESEAKKKKKKKKKDKDKGSDSDDAETAKKKRARLNNFSSIRNIEKEKAKTRGFRSAGADAAAKLPILAPALTGPYFAP